MPEIVRVCSESLKTSSARSTFTCAFVGTARTWRGSLRRLGRRGGGGGSCSGSVVRRGFASS